MMNTRLAIHTVMMLLAVGVHQAGASMVITPEASGSANGYQDFDTGKVFNAQPSEVPTEGTTTDDFGGGTFTIHTNAGRGIFIDFGENFDQITLEEVWFGLNQYGTNPGDPNETVASYWSPVNTVAAAQVDGVSAPDFFFGWTGATSDRSWQRIWSGTETVKDRYYVQVYDGTQSWTNRAEEIVFVGNVIPEPSSIAMILFGLVAFGRLFRPKGKQS